MKESELNFDRNCHVIYSKECEAEIKNKISVHYPLEEQASVWEKVQQQYVDFLSDWRKDLGGAKNFHNGKGGTYDCIALMSYYVVCKDKANALELEEMEGELVLPALKKLRFVNINKPFWKKLIYAAFKSSKKRCDEWNDYKMHVADYDKNKPIYYEFTACPVAEFAQKNGLLELMPYLCNVDFAAMELLHGRLVRMSTCANGDKCDYTIAGDEDEYAAKYPQYRDEEGYITNK